MPLASANQLHLSQNRSAKTTPLGMSLLEYFSSLLYRLIITLPLESTLS